MISRSHPVAKRLRALRNDPALRDAEGVVVAEGVHLALEALKSRVPIEAAVFSARLAARPEGSELLASLRSAGTDLHETTDGTLDALQDARSPQPIVVIARFAPAALADAIGETRGTPLVVVACGVQEPGNLGALSRTADAAGATGFVATPDGASLTHPRTVRASMGSLFRLETARSELGAALDAMRRAGLRLVGADAGPATDYDTLDWCGPLALLLGSEGAGLPAEARAALDARVRIPMAPGVESLSVNAAAAVLLFAAARARAVTRAG